MLPLHLAFRSGTSAKVMETLLQAYPEGIRIIDHRGYIPLSHCQQIKGTNKQILESYAKANLKLEHESLVDTSRKDREAEVVSLTEELERRTTAHANQVQRMVQEHAMEVEKLKRLHDGEKEQMKEDILEMTREIAEYQRIEESRHSVDDVMLSRGAD